MTLISGGMAGGGVHTTTTYLRKEANAKCWEWNIDSNSMLAALRKYYISPILKILSCKDLKANIS